MLFNLSLVQWFVIASVFINAAGSITYIRDTLKGKTKPNRVSWFMWATVPVMGTIAALSAGADAWATVRVFMAGFFPLVVFTSSFFNRDAYWKLGVFDFICGLLAVIGLIVWKSVSSPQLAILFLAAADGFAAIPTLVKAWQYPETETGTAYIAGLASVVIILPSIPVWNIENSAFQVYLLVVNTLLLIAVYRKRWGFNFN